MRRGTVILFVALNAITIAILCTQLLAAAPESEELAIPFASPSVITPEAETIILFRPMFQDPSLKSPRLQSFDPNKGKWRTLKRLKDNGKAEDLVKGDRIFSASIWVLADANLTQLGFKKANGAIRVKLTVASPAQLRLSAKKKTQLGSVVSPSFWPGEWQSSAIPNSAVQVVYPKSLNVETYGVPNSIQWTYFESTDARLACAISVEETLSTAPTVVEWADEVPWPYPDNWRDHLAIVSIAGMPALASAHGFILKAGSRLYRISNGLGWTEEEQLDDITFSAIVESLMVTP